MNSALLSHLPLNQARPQIMHIDLNSCFAMVEQQANPFLRGKPVAVTNRLTRGAMIVAASYEAKRQGIGLGTRIEEARAIDPRLVVLETDPDKYIYTHKVFKAILQSYSPDAHMKSIDEGVIDFTHTRQINKQPLVLIGQQIKQRLRAELGQWMSCNVGLAPNRFLAKVAAGLHKPDGLDVINHHNLPATFASLELMDLPGINKRFKARLNSAGIYTVVDFFNAPERLLTKFVFRSVGGQLWYARLRGWEVDNVSFGTKTVGRQYVLPPNARRNPAKLRPILMKLCEGVGRKLRSKGYCAYGLAVSCYLEGRSRWSNKQLFNHRLYSTPDLYKAASSILECRPSGAGVNTLFVTAYKLQSAHTRQLAMFETADVSKWRLTDYIDSLNNKYGDFVVTPGTMANTKQLVPTKIPFGTVKYFD